jgi:putative transcriptional regulator
MIMTDSVKEAIGSAVQDIIDAGVKVSFTKKELDELGVKVPTVELSADDIKNIRKKMNLSQMVFAKLLNVSLSSVRQWEQGARKPSGSTMVLLELLQKDSTVLDYRLDLKVA